MYRSTHRYRDAWHATQPSRGGRTTSGLGDAGADASVCRGVRGHGWLACFFCQAEDGIRDKLVTGVQTCALPIYEPAEPPAPAPATIQEGLAREAVELRA